jgi:hypothetical protein
MCTADPPSLAQHCDRLGGCIASAGGGDAAAAASNICSGVRRVPVSWTSLVFAALPGRATACACAVCGAVEQNFVYYIYALWSRIE